MPFLPLRLFASRLVALRLPNPNWPAICFIILRASKNRLTRSLTSPTATPDPLAMRSRREPLMIFGSARSAGVMPRMIACSLSSWRSSTCASWSFIWFAPGSMPRMLPIGPILRIGEHLLEEVLQRQLAGADLGRGLGRLLGVEGLLGLLDQGEQVAHPEDAAGHPVRVEDVEVGELLAVGREQDRLAGDLPDRQRRTTAGVAVQLGEHDAGEADAVAERLGRGHGVLADHRVDDEQGLVGRDGVADVRGLLHQLGVDAEAARGVDDHDVVVLLDGVRDAAAGDVDRVADPVARARARTWARPPARRRSAAG